MDYRKKGDIDRAVADEGGLKVRDVRTITAAFLSKVLEALLEDNVVILESFGRFTLRKSKPGNSALKPLKEKPVKGKKPKRATEVFNVDHIYRVHFKKSETFNNLLRLHKGPNGQTEKK